MNDTQRILEIIKVKQLNNIQFCSITGISPASLSHITSNRSKPTLTILRNVISGFPDINPEWIMMGTGSMFREGGNGGNASAGDSATVAARTDGNTTDTMPSLFPDEDGSNSMSSRMPSLDYSESHGVVHSLSSGVSVEDVVKTTLSVMQKPRRIVEVRIFFDDGTYESFGGKAKA